MVKKMKFVNIMGPTADLGRVNEQYISNYEIQIEDAVKEMGSNNKDISFYSHANHLVGALKDIEKIADLVNVDETYSDKELSLDESLNLIQYVSSVTDEFTFKTEQLKKEKKGLEDDLKELAPFIELDFSLEKLYKFNFIKYRFGRIPISGYKHFETYLHANAALLFQKIHTDPEYVWGIYFVPKTMHEKVDAIFASLYFERVEISSKLTGKPAKAYADIRKRIEKIDADIAVVENERVMSVNGRKDDISAALRKIRECYSFAEMQKNVAKTDEGFYIIVGWMDEKAAFALADEVVNDDNVTIIVKDNSPNITPPTKLWNPLPFRPFEFFVKMYGLPAYNEIDPTPFFAITYTILFGIMFGDLGQGLILSLFGLIYSRIKKAPLGAILFLAGLSSAVFGTLYGSVFGYEEVFPAIWIKPLESTSDILLSTVAFGVVMNISAMFIQIINSVKKRDWSSLLFSPNGISGVMFYTVVIIIVLSVAFGTNMMPDWAIELLAGLPLLFIFLREPLGNLIKRQKKLIKGSLGEYIMESFFETFEVLLGFVTNTISFVRVGAFALCHAGMMGVVHMLAGASHGSSGNLIVIIIGNLFVMCLEGLIVSIQVLRLQYYEMFSRFFKGNGKAFNSYKSK